MRALSHTTSAVAFPHKKLDFIFGQMKSQQVSADERVTRVCNLETSPAPVAESGLEGTRHEGVGQWL